MQLLDLRSDAVLHAGDMVTTSGLGGVYPSAIPIGQILSVTVDKTRSLQTATLRPAADFDHLEEAFVIQPAPPLPVAPLPPATLPPAAAPAGLPAAPPAAAP